MTIEPNSGRVEAPARELSPLAELVAMWFKRLGRAIKTLRLYRSENPFVVQLREQISQEILDLVQRHGGMDLRVRPSEILLEDQPVVRVKQRGPGSVIFPGPEEEFPFLLYRDGIRLLRFLPKLSTEEVGTFIEAMAIAGRRGLSQDDLVTLLWQANLVHIQIESVPLEQTIYLSSRPTEGRGRGSGRGLAFGWSPSGEEIHADLGQVAGSQGLHKDNFDDWELPGDSVDVVQAYARLLPEMETALEQSQTEWVQEWVADPQYEAPDVLRLLLSLDPSDEMRRAVVHSVVTWLVASIETYDWSAAQRALELLVEFDPERALSLDELNASLAEIDTESCAEHLDESEPLDQARFFALMVGLGRPALGLAVAVMAQARRSRTRAASLTALAYLCRDCPETLEPHLADTRWYVVRNIVFVLGQIGGHEVLGQLTTAAHHPELRVRRQVVLALGSVSPAERRPLVAEQLDSDDPRLLSAALNMLARDDDPEVGRQILARITAPSFERRRETSQHALFAALAEVADDSMVPALDELLRAGGWFAQPTYTRSAAALILCRIGTDRALAVLETGLRDRSEAVRNACLEAMDSRSRL